MLNGSTAFCLFLTVNHKVWVDKAILEKKLFNFKQNLEEQDLKMKLFLILSFSQQNILKVKYNLRTKIKSKALLEKVMFIKLSVKSSETDKRACKMLKDV